jgi:hypothetical protein
MKNSRNIFFVIKRICSLNCGFMEIIKKLWGVFEKNLILKEKYVCKNLTNKIEQNI